MVFIIGSRLFYFQTNRERKIDNKELAVKKGFLSFYSVCMLETVFFNFQTNRERKIDKHNAELQRKPSPANQSNILYTR